MDVGKQEWPHEYPDFIGDVEAVVRSTGRLDVLRILIEELSVDKDDVCASPSALCVDKDNVLSSEEL